MMSTSKRPLRLSLCLIAKDEEETIGHCLASAAAYVDEMIVVDTGSTDRTVEIARSAGAKVLFHRWDKDFAAARNTALHAATGDWILSLDADEVLDAETAPNLRAMIAEPAPRPRAFGLLIRNAHDKEEVQLFYTSYGKRLFPRLRGVKWVRPVHEQVTLLDAQGNDQFEYVVTDRVVIYHYGYMSTIWRGKQKEARNLELLHAAIAAEPADPFNHYNLGQELYGAGHFADARPYLVKAVELTRTWGSAMPYIAYSYALAVGCYLELRQPDQGIALGEEGLQRFEYADLLCNLGSCYLAKGESERAIYYFTRGHALEGVKSVYSGDASTTTWRPLQNIGNAYLLRNDYVRALHYYQQSLSYAPDRPYPNFRAAQCLLALNRVEEAKGYVRTVLAAWPDHLEANLVMIDCMLAEQDVQSAYDRLDELVREQPESSRLRLRLAELLDTVGEKQEALNILARGMQQEPKDAQIYQKMGLLLIQLKRYDDAIKAFTIALSVDPTLVPAQAGLKAAEIHRLLASR